MMSRCKTACGYMTVYMTMTLAVLLSLCMTMIEGARRSAMRMEAELITDTAMRSVFAEYNRELMKQYNIFAIDSSYGTTVSGIDEISGHFRDYMEKNYSADVVMPWQGSYRCLSGRSLCRQYYLSDGRIRKNIQGMCHKRDKG